MYTNRLSTTSRYNLMYEDIHRNQLNFERLTAQIASGKRLQSIKDDPIAAVNVINANRQLGQMDTFATNIKMGMAELDTLDDLLTLARGHLTTAWDKAVQANNQTYGDSALEALKIEIDEIVKTMVDLANTEYNDNYIFGGANTKINPYEIDENGDVIYNGTPYENPDYVRRTEVADGVFEVLNTTGDRVFGYYRAAATETADGNKIYTDPNGKRVIEYTDEYGAKTYKYENSVEYTGGVDTLTEGAEEECVGVMGALKKLSESIQMVLDGDTEAGYEQMNSTLDMFSDSLDMITREQDKFGGVYNRLEMTNSSIETNNTNLTEYLSTVQDIDIAEAISLWYQAQYAYQASLQVTSASMGMSLLNYL